MLKPRRWGGTTEETAQSLYLASTVPGVNVEFYAETDEDAQAIFRDTALVMYEGVASHRGSDGKPLLVYDRKTDNSRSLNFAEAHSTFTIGSAEKKTSGHGHTIHKLHLSEFSRYPPNKIDQFWGGVIPAVVPGGEAVVECTANGASGKFYELYQIGKARKDWYSIAYFWYDAIDDPQYSYIVEGDYAAEILTQVATGQGHEYAAEERDLAERLSLGGVILTAGQWAWRRGARDEFGQQFFEAYPEDDESCFLTSGRLFFDPARLDSLAKTSANEHGIGKPLYREEHGDLWVWEEPIPGREYMLSSDVAQGITVGDNSDRSTFSINDMLTGDDCVEFAGRNITPDQLGRLIDKWGRKYNDATAIVERNGHGFTTLQALKENRYPAIWCDPIDHLPGWKTTEASRPYMLDKLAEALRKEYYLPRSSRFINECRTFIVNKDGRPEAASGRHDDLISCKAINYQGRTRYKETYVFAGTF